MKVLGLIAGSAPILFTVALAMIGSACVHTDFKAALESQGYREVKVGEAFPCNLHQGVYRDRFESDGYCRSFTSATGSGVAQGTLSGVVVRK